MTAQQGFPGILNAGNPRYRCDDLILLLPRIHPVVGSKNVAADYFETFAELVFEFTLPLKRKIRGRHNQGPFYKTTDLELCICRMSDSPLGEASEHAYLAALI